MEEKPGIGGGTLQVGESRCDATLASIVCVATCRGQL
jgi:hypothetical protein